MILSDFSALVDDIFVIYKLVKDKLRLKIFDGNLVSTVVRKTRR